MYLSQCSLLVLFSVTIHFQVAFSTKKGGANAPNAPPQPTGLGTVTKILLQYAKRSFNYTSKVRFLSSPIECTVSYTFPHTMNINLGSKSAKNVKRDMIGISPPLQVDKTS